jgi:four helix bundle protein
MNFKDLKVWQKSKSLAIQIYQLTDQGKIAHDFGLRDQMRRAAVSVCSNIAEGDERGTNKDSVRFLYIAKGSLAELLAQLEISTGIGHFQQDQVAPVEEEIIEIGKMLGSLIKARTVTKGYGF